MVFIVITVVGLRGLFALLVDCNYGLIVVDFRLLFLLFCLVCGFVCFGLQFVCFNKVAFWICLLYDLRGFLFD